jgi:hypothetical protein
MHLEKGYSHRIGRLHWHCDLHAILIHFTSSGGPAVTGCIAWTNCSRTAGNRRTYAWELLQTCNQGKTRRVRSPTARSVLPGVRFQRPLSLVSEL